MYSLFFKFDVVKKLREIFLAIDEIIYGLVNYLFSVFDVLSRTRLFSSDIISDLTNRTYIIISVVMLFALTYSIMSIIINPDKASGKDKNGFGIVKRVIVALLVLVFTPTVFDFAYGVQESVIDSNVIGRLLLGRSEATTTEELKGEFTVSLFQGSFYLTDKAGDLATLEYEDTSLSAKINGDISAFEDLLDYVDGGQAKYNIVVSLIVGGFAVYCLVIFCFDLGVRCAKLAFFQMIAPIPALLYIIPGKEGSFKTWVKEVLSTFFEVFVRVGVIYFITYAFYLISRALDNGSLLGDLVSPKSATGVLVNLFIILGLLVFALRAPKLICDILGIKSDGLLNFKKRWDEGKKAVMMASTPVRKPAGAIAGQVAANSAYKRGLKNGNKGSFSRRLSANIHGLSNGWRSGVMNAGNAYDYEFETQQTYARNPELGGLRGALRAEREHLQRKLGFESPYEYERRDEMMRMENDIRRARRENENFQGQKQVFDKNSKAIYDSYIRDNKDAYDKNEKLDSSIKSWVGKASSKAKRSLNLDKFEIDTIADIEKRTNEINSLKSKTNLTLDEQNRLAKLNSEVSDLNSKLSVIRSSKDHISEYIDHDYINRKSRISTLEAELASISPDQRTGNEYITKSRELEELKNTGIFVGNYSELDKLSTQLSDNDALSYSERQVIDSIIGGLKKSIINEHKAKVITDVSQKVFNEDTSSSSLAQELINMLSSNDTSIGRKAAVLSDEDIRKMASSKPGEQLSQADIDRIRASFQMDKDGAIAKFREILQSGQGFSSSDVKDIGDELNKLTNIADMAKRNVNTNAQFKVLDYDLIRKEMLSALSKLEKTGASKAEIEQLRRDFEERMYTSGYDTDVIMKRNKELIDQRQEDFKNFELTHLNDKEISESRKKLYDMAHKHRAKKNDK